MSVQISVQLDSLDALASGIKGLGADLSQAVGEALMNVGERILDSAQVLVPVRTGYLKSTLQLEKVSDFQLRVKATAGYAYYVEFGMRRMSPRLFLTHAVEQHLSEFAPEIEWQVLLMVQAHLSK